MRLCTVLVVDDDSALRDTLDQLLCEEGYTVELAPDGAVALETLRAAPSPMVVLLDLMMPRLNGQAVLEAVVADPDRLQRHRYIAMTASASALTEPLVRMMAPLEAESIIKPFNIEHLLELVAASAARLVDE